MASATQFQAQPPVRRVRHGVRDGLAVMAFSLATSAALALLMLLITQVLLGARG